MGIDFKNVKEFISEQYPETYAAMISGSLVQNLHGKFSDIDVITFTNHRNKLFNETIEVKKNKIQIFVIPLQTIEERLYNDYLKRKCHFIGMIVKGKILFDNNNFLQNLITHCVELKKIGPHQLSFEEHRKSRILLTGLRNKISNNKLNWNDKILEIGSLIDELSWFKLVSEGYWTGDGIHRMQFLKEYVPRFREKIITAVKEAHCNENFKSLIKLADDTLKSHGGHINYYSSNNSFLTVNNDFICIFIPNYVQDKNVNILTLLNEKLISTKSKHPSMNFYFFKSKFGDYDNQGDNAFCFIHANKEWINSVLIQQIKKSSFSKKIVFPFFFNAKYNFSDDKIYDTCLPSFVNLSSLVFSKKENLNNTEFKIEISLLFFKHIKEKWFCTDKRGFSKFLEYLVICWLPLSFDNSGILNSKDLLLKRGEVLNAYQHTYEKQRLTLLDLYKNKNIRNLNSRFSKILENLSFPENDLVNFPIYKLYFTEKFEDEIEGKYLYGFLKEYTFRLLEILLISYDFVAYIPFILSKLEKEEINL